MGLFAPAPEENCDVGFWSIFRRTGADSVLTPLTENIDLTPFDLLLSSYIARNLASPLAMETNMPDQSAAGEIEVPLKQGAEPPELYVGPTLESDPFRHQLPQIALGIILAGGAYPLVVAGVYASFGIVATLWSQLSGFPSGIHLDNVVMVAIILAVYSVVGGMMGLVWTSFVALVTLPIVYLFVRSLRLEASIVWLGACFGGLVGFVAVLPFLLNSPLSSGNAPLWAIIAVAALGPGLTTIMGQLGGAWGGVWAVRATSQYEVEIARATVGGGQTVAEQPTTGADSADAATKPRFQFGTRHLLWVAVWLSLLLTVIRLSGIPFEFVLPLLLGWLVYQAGTLYVGWLLLRRLGPPWTRRSQPFHVKSLAN